MSLTPRRRSDDRLPHRIWRWMRRVLVMIGVMVVFSVVMLAVSVSKLSSAGKVDLTDNMVLAYVLDQDLSEVPEPPSLRNPRLVTGETLHDVIAALDLARQDERVKAFVVRLDGLSLSLAQVQELRAAVLRFRAAGKHAAIFAPDYGAMGSAGVAQYYLASAFSDIWVQPVGGVALPGLAFQVPFVKTLLDKIGVEAEMMQKGDYKSAPESLTATSMSAPARANLSAVLDDMTAQVVADVAAARGIDAAAVRAALDRGLLDGDEAVAAKLATHVGYIDDALKDVRARAGQGDLAEDKGLVPLGAYFDTRSDEVTPPAGMMATWRDTGKNKQAAPAPKNVIAVITASGEIVDDAAASAMAGGLITPESMRKAFAEVRKRDDIAAIVLRIDSPGGSAFASESIRRFVLRAKERGVPVVVSMGGAAASGGYWIASAADHIVAQPATLTGSIGVFGGKFVIGGALQRMGVNVETLKSAPHADMMSALRPLTAGERALFDRQLQSTYDAFITRVAEGRKMTPDAVEKIAGGQVFSGQQAKNNGLVDTLGGLDTAVDIARGLGGLKEGDAFTVVDFPEQRSPFAMIVAVLAGEKVMMPLRPETLLLRQHAAVLAPVAAVR